MVGDPFATEDDPQGGGKMNYLEYFKSLNGKCVYCSCKYVYEGNFLKCLSCGEKYIDLSDYQGYGNITFTCKNFYINFEKEYSKIFAIRDFTIQNNLHWIEIPVFEIDFSNKEALYKKIKNYLLFS